MVKFTLQFIFKYKKQQQKLSSCLIQNIAQSKAKLGGEKKRQLQKKRLYSTLEAAQTSDYCGVKESYASRDRRIGEFTHFHPLMIDTASNDHSPGRGSGASAAQASYAGEADLHRLKTLDSNTSQAGYRNFFYLGILAKVCNQLCPERLVSRHNCCLSEVYWCLSKV